MVIRAGTDPISSSLQIATSYETMHDYLTIFHGFKMDLWAPSIHWLKMENMSCSHSRTGISPHRILIRKKHRSTRLELVTLQMRSQSANRYTMMSQWMEETQVLLYSSGSILLCLPRK